MNWNPFKRIAALERDVRTLTAQVTDLDRNLSQLEFIKVQAHGKWLVTLESRLQDLSNPVAISRADVEKEAKRRLQRAAYARKYYAKKRAAKAAAAGDAK